MALVPVVLGIMIEAEGAEYGVVSFPYVQG